MPELPEVETVRRGLVQTILDKTVASVEVRVPKLLAEDRALIDAELVGATVTRVDRRAKLLLLALSSGWTLIIHLKMTGQIVVMNRDPEATNHSRHSMTGFVGGHPERAYDQELPHQHTHVLITFADGTVLYFNDLRKFGWMRLLPGTTNDVRITNYSGPSTDEYLASLDHGPEPLEDAFTLQYFQGYLEKRKTLIKPLLLDQRFIAGVGNIYADEALFMAAIKPTRRANSLTQQESERLFHAIRQVLQLGIDYGGTSFNSYRTVEGTAGKMRDYLKVYGREGQTCSRCGDLIVRHRIGQRSAHFCPNCQR